MNKNSYFVSDLECIGGDIINKQKCPRAVSTTCPHCSANAVFSLVNIYQITPIGCWPRHGKCPKCMRSVKFVFFFEDSPSNEAINPSDVAIFPTPQNARRPINLPDDLPQRLKRAIKDTEETFQSGLYSPCLTSGRRALEGIFKQLAHEEDKQKNLFSLIEEVLASEEATSPLKDLSHAIRKGGNLGAHFDELIEPNKETARLVLELLEYLVAYFFSLPSKIEDMSKQISGSLETAQT